MELDSKELCSSGYDFDLGVMGFLQGVHCKANKYGMALTHMHMHDVGIRPNGFYCDLSMHGLLSFFFRCNNIGYRKGSGICT